MVSFFWISLVLLGVLHVNLTTGRSLVKPPYLPRPTRGPRMLLENGSFNHSTATPPCTTVDVFFDEASGNLTTRNGLTTEHRWTQFHVVPDPDFQQWELDVINEAMWNLWQIIPCVDFGLYPSSALPTGDHIRLIKGTNNGCNSHVGRNGGRQDMNLQSPGCITVGIVMHEMLHALGFYHEHCRYDRDDYITVNLDNVMPEYQFAFNKVNPSRTSTLSVPYNYNSIMHYGELTFTKNGRPTMEAKNGQIIGMTGKLQTTDVRKLKSMYNC